MSTAAWAETDGFRARLGRQYRVAINETAKGLRLMRRRWAVLGTAIVMNAVVYLTVNLFIGAGHIVRPLMTLTLPALSATAVATIAAVQGSGGIAEEIAGGTLEHTQLSPAPPGLHLLGRLGALAVEGVAVGTILGIVFAAAFGLHYHLHPSALIPALLTVADALGYGLLLTALTVRVTSIGAITHVFNMAVQFFGGMLVPVTAFPHGLETFARFLPVTLGVQAINATLAGEPLSTTWTDGTLRWLLLHVTVSLALAWAIYSANIRRGRRAGGLR